MSKIKDKIKEMQLPLPKIAASEALLKLMIESAEEIEKAATKCRIDKVMDGIVEVEWHRQMVGYHADELHVTGEISDAERRILQVTALSIRKMVFKMAENTIIDNCGCRFQ